MEEFDVGTPSVGTLQVLPIRQERVLTKP